MVKRFLYSTILTVLVGLFFSFLAAMSLYQSEHQSIEYEVQKDVENAALSLSRELNVSIELLYALRNQLVMTDTLNEEVFIRLASEVMDRHPNIKAIEWADVVKAQNRALYEAESALEFSLFEIVELSPEGDLKPAGQRSQYFPIRYVSPIENNQNIIGFDIGSRSMMKNALMMSWYRGVPIATPALNVSKEIDEIRGFLTMLPVFYGDPETDADRQTALYGFLLALFDVSDVFQIAISNTVKESINLELIDKGLNNQSSTIFRHTADITQPAVSSLAYTSRPIYFAGREWQLKGAPSEKYVDERMSVYPKLIFCIGVLIFSLLAYLLYTLQHRAMTIQRRVDEKTLELREANKKLEKLSKTDGLTGFYNRDYFDDVIGSEVKRTKRDNLYLSIMMLEIDNMSAYNTARGRVAGDKVIRMIGQAVADVLKRPGDLVCRYTGETFAVLMPNTKDGDPIAKRCIDAVMALKLPFENEEGTCIMTVSVGGVTVLDVAELDENMVVSYAELALSKAVLSGRNCSHWIYLPEEKQPH